VLCVHGFPDSPVTWRHLAPSLAAAGLHVVMPWLRGYPPSEVVDGSYQVAVLARDVLALANALSPGRPVRIVGHDWGGLAAYGAATLAPDRVDRIVVLSVAPTRAFRAFLVRDGAQQQASWYQFLFQLSPLGERVLEADDLGLVDRLWAAWSPGWPADPEALAAAKETIRAGFPAALSFYRDTWQPARQEPELAEDQRRIVEGPVPVATLVLHGGRDGCILPGAFEGATACLADGSAVVALPDVGHFLHLEDPVGVARRILGFLLEEAGGATGGPG
jgi:pimeloyl-ACP methyl ester carboxylesterase